MLSVKNCNVEQFKIYIKNKKVFLFGAGRALDGCLDYYFENRKVEGVIDNNSDLHGKIINYQSNQIKIRSVEQFVAYVKKHDKQDIVLLITSPIYGAEIVNQLDQIPELDSLECYLQIIIANTIDNIPDFEFEEGINKIPKKIHYIWMGKHDLPEEFKRNIDTWRTHNPEYQILGWNEGNYDFKKHTYMKEAYEACAWGFASNYARLDILYEHGGIYLDTDVKVIKKLDCLLKNEAFLNMGCGDRVSIGVGVGAKRGSPFIKLMKEAFDEKRYILNDGTQNKQPYHQIIHPVLKKWGFEISNKYQKVNDVVLYPNEVMSPITIGGMQDYFTNKTLSIHKESGSWRSEREKQIQKQFEQFIKCRILR